MNFFKNTDTENISYLFGGDTVGLTVATDLEVIEYCKFEREFFQNLQLEVEDFLTEIQYQEIVDYHDANPILVVSPGAGSNQTATFTFETVECLVTSDDEEGLIGVLLSFEKDWITEALVTFKNGNSLILTHVNVETFGQAWADARAVFFV